MQEAASYVVERYWTHDVVQCHDHLLEIGNPGHQVYDRVRMTEMVVDHSFVERELERNRKVMDRDRSVVLHLHHPVGLEGYGHGEGRPLPGIDVQMERGDVDILEKNIAPE